MIGIYYIENNKTNKKYIGSSKNISKRLKRHFNTLKLNKHHNIYLQREFNKYGQDSFCSGVLQILEIDSQEDLFSAEKNWIDSQNPEYNIGSVSGGDNYTNHPDKEKLRVRLLDNLEFYRENNPPLRRYGEDNPNWKGGISKSYCGCGSEKSKGANKCSTCRDRSGINNPFYGKKHTDETKAYISSLFKGGERPLSRKKVCIEGVTYDSCTIAAKELNVSAGTITYRVKSKYFDYNFVDW